MVAAAQFAWSANNTALYTKQRIQRVDHITTKECKLSANFTLAKMDNPMQKPTRVISCPVQLIHAGCIMVSCVVL